MTQADSVHSTPPTNTPIEPTRRRFLSQTAGVAAGGAALALATIPPASATAAPASALDTVFGLDAEIIAAGKAFEPLLSKYLDAQFIWMRLSLEASDAADAKYPSDNHDDDHPKWAFHLQMGEQNGCTKASARLSEIHEEMEPLADLIREASSETIEGLRAKTLVAIWDCQPIYSTHEGEFNFSDKDSHQSLFHAAVAMTGLSEMVSAIGARLQIAGTIPQDGET
jgi:hypothetical protein